MKSKTIKKLYTLHSWVGVVTGILLFVIAFTGAISVFGRGEIKVWANPEIRALAPIDSQKVEQLIGEYAKKVPDYYKEEVLVFIPGARGAKTLYILFEAHSGKPVDDAEPLKEGEEKPHNPAAGAFFEFDPNTYELIDQGEGLLSEIFVERRLDMADFLVDFHADLHLGRPIGLLTTGVLGLTMMMSIITGIFIHRKILAQLFTFRPRRNFSLLLNDGHKVIGVWGLLFNSVIAFTGAFLGLVIVLLVPAAAFVSFGGDQEKLIETFTAVPDPIIQNIQTPTQIGNVLEHARNLGTDAEIGSLTIKGYGDASAAVYVSLIGGQAVASQTAVYNGADGEFVEKYSNFAVIEGYSGPILDLLGPLHFGNFGGIFVKFLWAVLGIGTALLPLTGLMLWLERGMNAANPKHSARTYRNVNRLVIGGCGGIVLATTALFHAQLIFNSFLASVDPTNYIFSVFFGTLVASIIWPFMTKNANQTAKHMTYLTAGLLLLIMPLNAILTGSHLLNVLSTSHYITLGVDLTTFILGLYLLHVIKQMKNARQQTNTGLEQPSDSDNPQLIKESVS